MLLHLVRRYGCGVCRDTCRDAPDNETGTVLLIGDSILKGYYPIVEGILDPGAKCMEDGTVRRLPNLCIVDISSAIMFSLYFSCVFEALCTKTMPNQKSSRNSFLDPESATN